LSHKKRRPKPTPDDHSAALTNRAAEEARKEKALGRRKNATFLFREVCDWPLIVAPANFPLCDIL
jgi:hypothetical protein